LSHKDVTRRTTLITSFALKKILLKQNLTSFEIHIASSTPILTEWGYDVISGVSRIMDSLEPITGMQFLLLGIPSSDMSTHRRNFWFQSA
jgi:hypothetical protein